MQIVPGSLVKLKTGIGPIMVVDIVSSNTSGRVYALTKWFDEHPQDGWNLKDASFALDTLELWDKLKE